MILPCPAQQAYGSASEDHTVADSQGLHAALSHYHHISSCMSLEAIRREHLLGAIDAGVASSGSLGCLCVFSAEAMVESCSCSSAASLAMASSW